jgi:hypothetical protein
LERSSWGGGVGGVLRGFLLNYWKMHPVMQEVLVRNAHCGILSSFYAKG